MRIIAIGSFYNDDNIAWRCLEALEPELIVLPTRVDIHYCDSPGTGLIHSLEGDRDTVLVDALLTDAAPGEVREVTADQLCNARALSSHDISVANVLELARNLGRLPARLNILGITVNPDSCLSSTQVAQVERRLLVRLRELAA